MDRYADIRMGDEAEIERVFGAEQEQAFRQLTGIEGASLPQVTLQAMAASLVSTLLGIRLPGEGCLWLEQKLEWTGMPQPGERLRCRGRVLAKSGAQRALTIAIMLAGADGRVLAEGNGTVRVLAQGADSVDVFDPTQAGAVIVSGASRGIGAATAHALAALGFPVIIGALGRRAAAEEVAQSIMDAGGRAEAILADVTDEAQVAAMVEQAVRRFGGLWGAVCNAAPPLNLRPAATLSWPDLAGHLDVNVKGSLNLIQACLPHCLAAGGGAFVTVSSVAARGRPPEGMVAYAAAKAALAALTRGFANEFGPRNIRFNSVSPGMADTEMTAALPEKARMLVRAQTPLRRLARPDDVASTIAWLMGSGAAHMTGQDLVINGGMVM